MQNTNANTNTTLYFLFGLASLAVIYFAFTVQAALSPLLIFIFVLYLLWPLRENPFANRLLWVSVTMFVIWFLRELSGLLTPFIVGFTLAYLFDPLMQLLVGKRVPRGIAALLITLLSTGIFAAIIALILPILISQIESLVAFATSSQDLLTPLADQLASLEIFRRLGVDTSNLRADISSFLVGQVGLLGNTASGIANTVASSIPTILAIATSVILIPFLTFYFLKDFTGIKAVIKELLPPDQRSSVTKYALMTGSILQGYFRGQLIIVVIQIAIYWGFLALIGVRYSLLLGVLSGVLSFIPYVGVIGSVLLSMLVALFNPNPGQSVFFVFILYFSVRMLEDVLLGPKIVGHQVGLNPIVLILSIFLFGHFFGFVGLLVAIPLAAVLIEVFKQKFLPEPEPVIAIMPDPAAVPIPTALPDITAPPSTAASAPALPSSEVLPKGTK
ncbi:MAG: AI-2E family transporter [Rhizobacter sp.]|nr:AI-2E family transporter [Chlorobiales bacterium]